MRGCRRRRYITIHALNRRTYRWKVVPEQSAWVEEIVWAVCCDVIELGLSHIIEAHRIVGRAEVHRDPDLLLFRRVAWALSTHIYNGSRKIILFEAMMAECKQVNIRVLWQRCAGARIKGMKNSRDEAKVGGIKCILGVRSRKPLTAKSGFQSLLRAFGSRDRVAKVYAITYFNTQTLKRHCDDGFCFAALVIAYPMH